MYMNKKLLIIPILFICVFVKAQLVYDTVYYPLKSGNYPLLQDNRPLMKKYVSSSGTDTTNQALWLPFGYDYINGSVSGSDTLVNAHYDKYLRDSAYQTTGAERPVYQDNFGVVYAGIDDYLTTNIDFNGSNKFTIYYNGKRNASGQSFGLGQGTSNAQRILIGQFVDNNFYFYTSQGASSTGINFAFDNNDLNKIVLIFDGTQTGFTKYKVYINGIEKTTGINQLGTPPTSISGITGKFYIGKIYVSGNVFSTGYFRDIMIFNRVLTEEEINRL